MSATILAFQGVARADFLRHRSPAKVFVSTAPSPDFLVAGHHLAPFSPAWCQQHLPLIDAAMELLEADDDEFARRCALMKDEAGRTMLGELAGQLQRLGAHIADVADALRLTAERIGDGMVAPAFPADSEVPPR